MAFTVETPVGRITVNADSAAIGRDRSCQIALPNEQSVQLIHATIKKVAGRWLIEANGDWSIQVGDGVPGRKNWLKPGDAIRLSEAGPELVFEPPATTNGPKVEPRKLPPPLPVNNFELTSSTLLPVSTPSGPASVSQPPPLPTKPTKPTKPMLAPLPLSINDSASEQAPVPTQAPPLPHLPTNDFGFHSGPAPVSTLGAVGEIADPSPNMSPQKRDWLDRANRRTLIAVVGVLVILLVGGVTIFSGHSTKKNSASSGDGKQAKERQTKNRTANREGEGAKLLEDWIATKGEPDETHTFPDFYPHMELYVWKKDNERFDTGTINYISGVKNEITNIERSRVDFQIKQFSKPAFPGRR